MNQAGRADNVFFHQAPLAQADDHGELMRGLRQEQKRVDPKWFYDEAGSALFESITQLPEYYPTRTEVGILSAHCDEISRRCGRGCLLIEPGSGNCEKVRLLLDSLRPAAYVPMDISADFLRRAATQLGREYPWLAVHAVCADFNRGWPSLDHLPSGKRVVFYPGSTIGNLEPPAAAAFLRRTTAILGKGGGLLIGVDLHKPGDRLHAAYNDSAGVTARFNLNLLKHINRELGAEFDTSQFIHRAFYDEELRRIEMHLVSKRPQTVAVNGSRVSFAELALSAGLALRQSWMDAERLFSVHYLEVERH